MPVIELVIFSPLVANVLPIISLPMALGDLPIVANGLPLIPIDNDIWAGGGGAVGKGEVA